jgi:hypothetical protein
LNLLKSTDGLTWHYAGTIISGSEYKPTETAIVFLEDGRCLAFIRLNEISSPTGRYNCLPGFAISSPPYTSWDFTLGAARRFAGPAAERFGDTILVVSRGEVGPWPGYWDIPGEPPSKPGPAGPRHPNKIGKGGAILRTFVYTFDLKTMRLEFQAILPSEFYADSSYAGIIKTGKDSALVSWYDGSYTSGGVSNIWLAHIKIV